MDRNTKQTLQSIGGKQLQGQRLHRFGQHDQQLAELTLIGQAEPQLTY